MNIGMNVIKAFCLFTLLGCFIGCKDDEQKGQSFNNNLPVEITGFEPKEVTSRTQFLSMEKILEKTPL